MQIKRDKTESILVLAFNVGVDEKGNEIIKTQRFSKLSANAKDEDILGVSKSLSSICDYPLKKVINQEISIISEE